MTEAFMQITVNLTIVRAIRFRWGLLETDNWLKALTYSLEDRDSRQEL